MAESDADFISFLSDEILQEILSYIPTKFAVRTSVLSKRWTYVWCETPSISIDCYGSDPASINKTLGLYSAPEITSFDLRISPDITSSQIDSWIKLAVSHKAKNMSLNVKKEKYKFPHIFFRNGSVKELSMDLNSYTMYPTCIVSWTSLRSLSLHHCNMSDSIIDNILSGSPMLESLTLDICKGFSRPDLSTSTRLTRLDIDCCNWYKLSPMRIVAPHIRSLRLKNAWQPCDLVNVSSLTEANLNTTHFPSFSSGYFESDDKTGFVFLLETVVKMLEKLQNIEKLTIGAIFLQIVSVAELRGVPFPQLKIKALVVETMIVRSIIPGITRLLQNSPGLKMITVHTMECSTIEDMRLDEYLNFKGLNPDQCWRSYGDFPTSEESCSMLDAKSRHVASFINLLQGNTMALETMVLQLGGYLNAKESEELLQMVPTFSYDNDEIVINLKAS